MAIGNEHVSCVGGCCSTSNRALSCVPCGGTGSISYVNECNTTCSSDSSAGCLCSGSSSYTITTPDSYFRKMGPSPSQYVSFRLALSERTAFGGFDGANNLGSPRVFGTGYYANSWKVYSSSSTGHPTTTGYKYGSTTYYCMDWTVCRPTYSGSNSVSTASWTVPEGFTSGVSGTLYVCDGNGKSRGSQSFSGKTAGQTVSYSVSFAGGGSGYAKLSISNFGTFYSNDQLAV